MAEAETGDGEEIPLVALTRDVTGDLEIVTEDVDDLVEAAEFLDDLDDATHDVVASDVEFTFSVAAPDPLRAQQYALDNVAFEAAWATADGTGTKIAILDTGVIGSHVDLDAAGKIQPGADFVQPGNGTNDQHGHGTHVAGIAAADAEDGSGIHGAAKGAQIVPVRVLDECGVGLLSDVAAGVEWAADQGVDVINMSLGSGTDSPVLEGVINDAVNTHNVVVVAAAGNLGTSAPRYPAAYTNVMGVGAIDPANQHASFSSTGVNVEISAPGSSGGGFAGVLSTLNTGDWGNKIGTSMASPYVAAAAAMVRQAFPGCSVAGVRALLNSTADPLGPANLFGSGRVDPLGAVTAASC